MLEFYKNRKILITGHTGFKGSWLSRMLILAGADVTGYALEPPTSPNLYHAIDLEGHMRSEIGDIRDFDRLMDVVKEVRPELVIHMAAQPIVRTSYENPLLTYQTNVMGTVNILECVRQVDSIRSFLNVTTDKVYDNKETDRGYVETDHLDGYDPYSNSKSCSEIATHSYQRSFFEDGRCMISTARAGNVIGGGDFAKDRIIPDCVRAVAAGKTMVIRNPYSIRPYQHVLEPLTVYLTILERQLDNHNTAGAYNVGPDDCDCVTTGKLVELFGSGWGSDFKYEIKSDGGPHEAGFLKLDCSKLKNTFGWKPKYHIEDAIAKTVEWTREYLDGSDITEITDRQIQEFVK